MSSAHQKQNANIDKFRARATISTANVWSRGCIENQNKIWKFVYSKGQIKLFTHNCLSFCNQIKLIVEFCHKNFLSHNKALADEIFSRTRYQVKKCGKKSPNRQLKILWPDWLENVQVWGEIVTWRIPACKLRD